MTVQKSVLDYKKQERQKEIKALEQECKNIETVVELKKERVELLDDEIDIKKQVIKQNQEAAEEKLEEIRKQNHQMEIASARLELDEVKKLNQELLNESDGDYYLKEHLIQLRYQNQMLKEENNRLSEWLDKAYEFMKQFVIGGINMLEKFLEWIGEKVRDVGRGR